MECGTGLQAIQLIVLTTGNKDLTALNAVEDEFLPPWVQFGEHVIQQKDGRVVLCTDDLPKSAVLCDSGVYLSQRSPATLLKRLENRDFE